MPIGPIKSAASKALAALLIAGSAAAWAEGWSGDGGAHGVVTDTAGAAIAGARVELTRGQPPEGPPAVWTDARGRWRLTGLAPGRYRLTIEAEGFIATNGFVQVSGEGVPRPVEVEMLPLDWRLPADSEGDATTVLLWLEKGNSLLAQGRPAEARVEFERALARLPVAERPQVLQAVARTHFLEGETDAAVAALVAALEIAPASAELRQLYSSLLAELGREEEAHSFLAELDARPPAPAAPAGQLTPPAPAAPQIPAPVLAIFEAEATALTAHEPGSFKARFTERSPLSELADYAARFEVPADVVRADDPDAGEYRLEDESFQVYVPAEYVAGEPHGLLVWISPTPFGGTLRQPTLGALAEARVIWVGAHHAGNARPVWDRIWLALDAAHNMRRLFSIDSERVYVAGYSGGGRATSRAAALYPEVFRGGFSLYGCNYFKEIPIPERPGTRWPARYPQPPKEKLRRIREESRFVLLTGPRDFNFTQTREIAEQMKKDGFQHVTYLEIPEADHYTWPAGEWWQRALAALDGPLR